MITESKKVFKKSLTGEELFALTVALGEIGYPDPQPEKLLTGLKDVALMRLAGGEPVIRQGEAPDNAYIVRSGLVLVTRALADGRRINLAELGEGSVFGEMSLLNGQVRSATVTPLNDCELFVLSGADFRYLLESSPVFQYRMQALADSRQSSAKV